MSKTNFESSNLLDENRIYVSYDSTRALGYGFYPDGRLIFLNSNDGFALKPEDVVGKNRDNAPEIGYWRVEGINIKTEFFTCANSGDYIRKEGKIIGDTIIFERNCGNLNPSKTEKCQEKYVLSDMRFD